MNLPDSKMGRGGVLSSKSESDGARGRQKQTGKGVPRMDSGSTDYRGKQSGGVASDLAITQRYRGRGIRGPGVSAFYPAGKI